MVVSEDLFKKIDNLRKAKKLSIYKLSKDSLVSKNSSTNWRDKHSMPSVYTLDAYCDVLGITLSELFAEEETFDEAATERRRIFTLLEKLTDEQRKNVLVMLDALVKNKQNLPRL